MTIKQEVRLRALNNSESTLQNIKCELIESGYKEDTKEFAESFASKLLIEFNKTLIQNENLKIDIENLSRQLTNIVKNKH